MNKALSLTVLISLSFNSCVNSARNGINLPPTQGTTNAGAFLPGIYKLDYTEKDLKKIRTAGFSAVRVPFNAATALDEKSLDQIEAIFKSTGYQGVLCFFDTREDGEGTHGNGKPNSIKELTKSWAAINKRFKNKAGIYYELFNEPFGYPRTTEGGLTYVREMKQVIKDANLPEARCILNGIGYADNIRLVAQSGWDGLLAYHFYPSWMHDGYKTQENFSNKIQADLEGLSHRVHITEFGANLRMGESYNHYNPDGSIASQDQNALRGFHDATSALRRANKGVLSTYMWHGWNNNDSYDFFDELSSGGANKIKAIQRDD